jgi:hypothetical protein
MLALLLLGVAVLQPDPSVEWSALEPRFSETLQRSGFIPIEMHSCRADRVLLPFSVRLHPGYWRSERPQLFSVGGFPDSGQRYVITRAGSSRRLSALFGSSMAARAYSTSVPIAPVNTSLSRFARHSPSSSRGFRSTTQSTMASAAAVLAPPPGRIRVRAGSGGCARYTRCTTGYLLSGPPGRLRSPRRRRCLRCLSLIGWPSGPPANFDMWRQFPLSFPRCRSRFIDGDEAGADGGRRTRFSGRRR